LVLLGVDAVDVEARLAVGRLGVRGLDDDDAVATAPRVLMRRLDALRIGDEDLARRASDVALRLPNSVAATAVDHATAADRHHQSQTSKRALHLFPSRSLHHSVC